MRSAPVYVRISLIALFGMISGCSQQKVAFRPEPIIWEMHDNMYIEPPQKRGYNRFAYTLDVYLNRQLDDLIDPVEPPPAMNTNALDEVPNSSWFTNRMGVLRMTRQEISAGPGGDGGSPESGLPWKVNGFGVSGRNRHLRITDNRGERFTLRFLDPQVHEAGTASEVTASRLLYAAGYNVPDNYIVHFTPNDVYVDSALASEGGAVTRDELDVFLSDLERREDGRFRALAVRDFDGVDCGPFPMTGTRDDDPNDLIPHEHRRELRALKVFCAWLGHIDVTPDNGMDVYIEGENGSYIRHYITSLSGCFGNYPVDDPHTHPGFEHRMLDLEELAKGTFTFGWRIDGWEMLERPSYAFAGHYYEPEQFDMERWKPIHPVPLFSQLTPQDAFWAAKIIAVFGDDHINGAIEQAAILPTSGRYIRDVLKGRQMAILDWAFSKVNPLDDFTLGFKMQGLVFDFMNLAEKYAIISGADLEYSFRIMDGSHDLLAEFKSKSMPEYVLPDRELGLSGEENYLIIEVRTANAAADEVSPPVRAHFFGGEQSGFALIGIERES
jgi:hypothetical protein